jgi:hypothetical protein
MRLDRFASFLCMVSTTAASTVAQTEATGVHPGVSSTHPGEPIAAPDLALPNADLPPSASSSAQPSATPQPLTQAQPPTTSNSRGVRTRMVTAPGALPPTVSAPGIAQPTVEVPLSSLPKRRPFNGEPSMSGYVLTERYRWWMVVTGGVLFAVGYVGALSEVSDHGFHDGLGFTVIPVAGPWIALGVHDEHCERGFVVGGCVESDLKPHLVGYGVLQAVGAILLPAGLLAPYKVWQREDLAMSVSPSAVGVTGQGLLLRGTF